MCTILNILNFIFGGFATTLGRLLAILVSTVLVAALSLTRPYQEVTRLSLLPYGSGAIRVDELGPGRKNGLLNVGGIVLNISRFIFFGWWLCLIYIFSGIVQCLTIIGVPAGIANFKIAAVALRPVGRRIVSVETVRVVYETNACRRLQ